jgi:hypothetical protein
MKYKATFIRTEKVQYFVEVEDVDMVSASQKAYDIFNNTNQISLDSLEHHYLDCSDYMLEIKREDV